MELYLETLCLILMSSHVLKTASELLWGKKKSSERVPEVCFGLIMNYKLPGQPCSSLDPHWWQDACRFSLFAAELPLCQNVHRLPPHEPSPPPVCPCSSKTSLTPPISTLGSFQSAFRPPNLSFHFPRYLLIIFSFLADLFYGFLDTLFSPARPSPPRRASCDAVS